MSFFSWSPLIFLVVVSIIISIKNLRNNNVLFGGVIMSFAAWCAIFMTLIGAISGAIFGTISSRN
ncbi:hypothetical protein BC30090_2316 [Bacillus cereus]|nr:hypothetical protein BC30090_2316 [Bacillus cereus]